MKDEKHMQELRSALSRETMPEELLKALGYNSLSAKERPIYLLLTESPSILNSDSYQVLRIAWTDCGYIERKGRLIWQVRLKSELRDDLQKSVELVQLGAKSKSDAGNYAEDVYAILKSVFKRDRISGYVDIISKSNFVCSSSLWNFSLFYNCTYKRGQCTQEQFDRIAELCNSIFALYKEETLEELSAV